MIDSEEAGSRKHWMLVNSSEQEQFVMLVEEALRRVANNIPKLDLLKGLES